MYVHIIVSLICSLQSDLTLILLTWVSTGRRSVCFITNMIKKFLSYQVVDDVEAVVLAVVGVDAAMSFFPHVILQRGFITEGFLTVQTLQTDEGTQYELNPDRISIQNFITPSLQRQLLLVQFALQSVQELVAVDDVVRQSDAEGMFSGHVVQQGRPEKHGGGSIQTP